MKKKKLNVGKLSLKKSRVAELSADQVTGGFQSWTGTAEPCFSEFGCGGGTGGGNQTQTCYCPPPPTGNCGTFFCGQTALFSACNGYNCY